jgi:threonine dehydratase
VELLSLIRIHPLAFMGFLIVGGGLLIAGVALYLYSLVPAPRAASSEDRS